MKTRHGFTLIELMIVVVIVGILAAIAIPKFGKTKEKAVVTAMKSDLRNLVTAEEEYYASTGSYSATLGAGGVRFQASRQVTLTVTAATVLGFSATTSHPATAQTCQVGVGDAVPGGAREGEPVCA